MYACKNIIINIHHTAYSCNIVMYCLFFFTFYSQAKLNSLSDNEHGFYTWWVITYSSFKNLVSSLGVSGSHLGNLLSLCAPLK